MWVGSLGAAELGPLSQHLSGCIQGNARAVLISMLNWRRICFQVHATVGRFSVSSDWGSPFFAGYWSKVILSFLPSVPPQYGSLLHQGTQIKKVNKGNFLPIQMSEYFVIWLQKRHIIPFVIFCWLKTSN